jgi:hypothetical protein
VDVVLTGVVVVAGLPALLVVTRDITAVVAERMVVAVVMDAVMAVLEKAAEVPEQFVLFGPATLAHSHQLAQAIFN